MHALNLLRTDWASREGPVPARECKGTPLRYDSTRCTSRPTLIGPSYFSPLLTHRLRVAHLSRLSSVHSRPVEPSIIRRPRCCLRSCCIVCSHRWLCGVGCGQRLGRAHLPEAYAGQLAPKYRRAELGAFVRASFARQSGGSGRTARPGSSPARMRVSRALCSAGADVGASGGICGGRVTCALDSVCRATASEVLQGSRACSPEWYSWSERRRATRRIRAIPLEAELEANHSSLLAIGPGLDGSGDRSDRVDARLRLAIRGLDLLLLYHLLSALHSNPPSRQILRSIVSSDSRDRS